MTHVLIAVDDSDTSVRAAEAAYRLFGDDARYTVINVAPDGPIIWGDDALASGMVYPLALPGAGVVGGVPFVVRDPDDPGRALAERIEGAEQRAQQVARDAGLENARPVGETGDAAEAILAAAREQQADVIVVGSHDRGWLSRLFTSSVTGSVVRQAEVPVLVAR